MTPIETGIIMDILTGAYPRFYPKGADITTQIKVWAEMFRDDPVELVAVAVKAIIASDTKGFPPHIGAVKAMMRQLTEPAGMTAAEAWAIVKKAICRSGYRSQEEYDKLPDTLKRLVGSPSQLRDWSRMDVDTLDSVIGSTFQRSFRERARQEQEYAAIPADVRAAITPLAERLALGGDSNGG